MPQPVTLCGVYLTTKPAGSPRASIEASHGPIDLKSYRDVCPGPDSQRWPYTAAENYR